MNVIHNRGQCSVKTDHDKKTIDSATAWCLLKITSLLDYSKPTQILAAFKYMLYSLILMLSAHGCGAQSDANPHHESTSTKNKFYPDTSGALYKEETFREIQDIAGMHFLHRNGATGKKYLIETMGSGGGFFDFDNDGWQDIYLVQSGPIPGEKKKKDAANKLFRNQGDGTFLDVTDHAGVGDIGYGMGCYFGDYDNDGDPDIYITNFGENKLYRNNGDGTFTAVTQQAGVGDRRWGTSAAFADYDQDGDLDLYVANFLTYSMANNKRCGPRDFLTYCAPDAYPGCPDVFYRNNGDGTFTDVTKEAGLFNDAPQEAKGLGVIWFDYDNDGDQDIYVANDGTPNFLYRNNADGTFTDVALQAGVAYNEEGKTEAGMGLDAGDYNWDGNLDIFVTHFGSESNTFYHNQGGGFFADYSFRTKLGIPSLQMVAWGTNFFDFDNDGWLDIYVANGHTLETIERIRPHSGETYAQYNQLFENDKSGRFKDISNSAGPHFQQRRVSRGAAFGDIDNDGDTDILVTNNNREGVLLLNAIGQDKDWIGFNLRGKHCNRDAIGARVELIVGGKVRYREVRSGSSYLCHNDLRIVFGLGEGEIPGTMRVRWPNGERQEIDVRGLKFNAYNLIEEIH